MKEMMVCNVVSSAFGSLTIAVACKVTGSALPLLAFMLIPRWSYRTDEIKDKRSRADDRDSKEN